ncbi:hypothetical protein AAVH_35375, partial [Aphelenchoides avenae]
IRSGPDNTIPPHTDAILPSRPITSSASHSAIHGTLEHRCSTPTASRSTSVRSESDSRRRERLGKC